MARRAGMRGLSGAAFDKEDLKRQAKSCGSFYFSPDSMRFFGSRILAVYPVTRQNATYFVEAKGGGRAFGRGAIRRHYTVGVFKNCRIQSLGKGVGSGSESGVYSSAKRAKQVARAIQSKAEGYGTTMKPRRRKRR